MEMQLKFITQAAY